MLAITLTTLVSDTYVSKYKLPAIDCAQKPAAQNDVTFFYQDSSPIFDFDNRLTHILQHKNQLLSGSPQWKDLSDYIFSFNIQNEGQGHLRNNIAPAPQWWCDRSKKMRSVMGSSAILISTGTSLYTYTSEVIILIHLRWRQRIPKLRHPRELGMRNPRPRRHPLVQWRIRMAQQSTHRSPARASRQETRAVRRIWCDGLG
jgi:hypothetical protein